MKHVLALLFLFLLCLAAVNCVTAQSKDPLMKEYAGFDPARDAARDIDSAVVVAGKTGRRILLDVGGEWCIWCHRLDRFLKDHADLKVTLNRNFVLVKINYSPDNKNEKVLSRYPKVPGYPHLFVLDAKGKLLHSQDTGELEAGKSYDHDKILAFLERWGVQGNR